MSILSGMNNWHREERAVDVGTWLINVGIRLFGNADLGKEMATKACHEVCQEHGVEMNVAMTEHGRDCFGTLCTLYVVHNLRPKV